jgi:hypothetical protein
MVKQNVSTRHEQGTDGTRSSLTLNASRKVRKEEG